MKKTLLALALAAPFFATPAHAKPVIYGTAEKVIKVAELPNEEAFSVGSGQYVDVGYCYKQLQVFFVPLWNWNEKYCGYVSDDTYTETSREEFLEIAKLASLDTAWDDGKSKIPMWDRIGGKVAGGVALLLFLLYALGRRNNQTT